MDKIARLHEGNKLYGIRKVSIDDVRLKSIDDINIKDTNVVFPKSGKTLKESLEDYMIVQLSNGAVAIYANAALAETISIAPRGATGFIIWVNSILWEKIDSFNDDLEFPRPIQYTIEAIWKPTDKVINELENIFHTYDIMSTAWHELVNHIVLDMLDDLPNPIWTRKSF